MSERLLEGAVAGLAVAAAASAGTAVNGAAIDMAGYDGVLIIGTITTANAGNYLKGQQGQLADASDMADLAGSKVVAAADASIVALDLYKPVERYVRGVIIRAGANTATTPLFYIRYTAHSKPKSSDVANVCATISLTSPAEGTP